MKPSNARYTKEVKHVSCLGGGGRDVTFRFLEPCPIESFVVVSMKWSFHDGKVRGNIRRPVFRRDKEELSKQIRLDHGDAMWGEKEFIEIMIKYLEGKEIEDFLQDMNFDMGIEIPKEYARELSAEKKSELR